VALSREGKVYFPEIGAPEAEIIERKLFHVGILNKDDQKKANLQVSEHYHEILIENKSSNVGKFSLLSNLKCEKLNLLL
jgi:hypothetical protein